ncbi:MAG TPA: alpha/beta fold hydrolase [Planctomycetaceae bacterium]|jgi:dienelactone hydrolase|nr:alpha/beta fold hydrolase [Planctomycetaceae bacterium]
MTGFAKPMRAALVVFAALLCRISTRADDRPAPTNPPASERPNTDAFRLLLQVYSYDPAIPLEGRIVERVEEHEGLREKIVFRGAQGFYVPGYLQFPAKRTGLVPCVLLLHGWSGSKAHFWSDNNYISGGNVRRGLLKEGFAVFALDAQCHGDRISQNEFAPVNPSGPPGVPARKGYFTQREIYVQTTIDYRRALDYLKGRSEIDSTRIGAFGYSMGGTQTFLLTGVEPRIKAAVACATPADLAPDSLIAPRRVAPAIGSRPFLMVMGRNDEMCKPEEAERVFRSIGSPLAKLSFHEGTHKIGAAFVPEAVAWLKKNL